MQAYGYVKYTGTMWMFSLAGQYPTIKFVCMGPSSTSGTGIDQSTIFSDLNNTIYQDNANKAIHRFIK